MAETPTPTLSFEDGCPDCGKRTISLPPAIPAVPDDIDLSTRDYDGFRLTMLEDLASRFPDRRKWTPGDIEVVIVEVLSAALDELSHDLDRLQREAFLESARNPASVRRLLSFIGYDAVDQEPDPTINTAPLLDRHWLLNPDRMETARAEGPRQIHTNRRMVTEADHATRLRTHPLVLDAAASTRWTGSWNSVEVVVILAQGEKLDIAITALNNFEQLQDDIAALHKREDILGPFFSDETTMRVALRWFIESERMIGRQVVLRDAIEVPISMSLAVRIADNYFATEVRRAIEQALGTSPGGFFAPGTLTFGEDLRASEIFQTVGAIDGVESVCLNRFKRLGKQFPDRSDSGVIALEGVEVAVCKNSGDRNDGIWTLTVHGGRPG